MTSTWRGTRRTSARPTPLARRRGAVAVLAVVTLFVVAAIASSLLRCAIERRLAVRRERFRDQAAWLAQAGLQRAAARLTGDPSYTGETWRPAASQLGGRHAARVEIQIEAAGDGARRIVVRADYPDHKFQRARQSAEAMAPPAAAGDET